MENNLTTSWYVAYHGKKPSEIFDDCSDNIYFMDGVYLKQKDNDGGSKLIKLENVSLISVHYYNEG